MNLADLGYVLMVAEEGNLTRAAKRLHLTPPALSEAIKRFERNVGVELFHRSNRGMELTDVGRDMLPDIEDCHRACQRLVSTATDVGHENEAKTLRVGSMFGFGFSALQKLMANPAVLGDTVAQIEILATDWTDVTAGLGSREADAGILVGPTEIDEELLSMPVSTEERVAVISKDNPLASRSSVTVEDLDSVGWVVPSIEMDQPWARFWGAAEARGGELPPRAPHPPVRTPMEMAVAIHNGHGVCTSIRQVASHFQFGNEVLVPVSDLPDVPVRFSFRPENDTAQVRLLGTALRTMTLGFRSDGT